MAQLHLTDEEQIGILQSFMAKAIVVVYLISKVNKLLNLGLIRGGGGGLRWLGGDRYFLGKALFSEVTSVLY